MRLSSLIPAALVVAMGVAVQPASAGPFNGQGPRAEVRQELRQDRRAVRRDVRQDRRAGRREVRQDRRIERREVRQDGRVGRREFRRDLRAGRQEFRQDRRAVRQVRRAVRREFRQDRRAVRRSLWYRGGVLPRTRFFVVDHRDYYLPAPRRGFRYMRVDGDLLLVALATGAIIDVLR